MSNTNDNTKNIRRVSFLALLGQTAKVSVATSAKAAENTLELVEMAGDFIEGTTDFLRNEGKDSINLARRNIRAMAWTAEREQREELKQEYGIDKDILEMTKDDFYKALDARETKNN